MNSTQIMRACLRHWDLNKDQIIPRCCLAGWEADLLIIKPSGWCEEVEIKISAGDFRREWVTKTEKHEALKSGRRRQVWMNRNRRYELGAEDVTDDPTFHAYGPHQAWHAVRRPGIIRRFWFALPKDLAEKLLPEVPAEYGVLAVDRWAEILRPATNLQAARKITDAERIRALHSTYHRFWQLTLREPAESLEVLLATDVPAPVDVIALNDTLATGAAV